MLLNTEQLNALADQACEAARLAGVVINSYTAGEVDVQRKAGGDSLASQVVTEVDERSQAAILERLRQTMEAYDLALLTEELSDDGSRFEKDYFWCIDPLDGTLPFTQGKSGYAVSIALVRRDGWPVIGVVYNPVIDRLYRAVEGQGVKINDEPWTLPARDDSKQSLKFCADCTFETDPNCDAMTARLESLARSMGYQSASIEVQGGAVCNACHVLENPPAVYLKEPKEKLGGGSSWDFAATACVFQEAGAYARDYSGAVLELNSSRHSFFNHCGICFCSDFELAEEIMASLPSR